MDSDAWDARYAASELVWSADPNRWVAAELAELRPGRALDLATGEGRNAIWLASRGWTVTAADFSKVALDKGRRIAESLDDEEGSPSGRIHWLEADVFEHVPEPGGYDLVLICYLQVPAGPRRTVVRRAAEALAPGGVLLVIGHDSTNLTDGVGGPQYPEVLFTPDDIVADLAMSGTTIRIDKAERVRREVPGEARPAIDALVRAVALGE
ncbi:MAG TPA: class I SAM-dependent methyltransferase [Jatrophihabitans sp.]|jgi:SAM-dependent methyltransferase